MTAAEAEALLRVTRTLAASPDLDHVLREVIAAAQQTLRAERGSVWLLDDAGGELVLHVGTGLGGVRQSVGEGIAGACATHRAIVNVPDCYADPRFNRTHDEASGYRTRNLLAIPLVGHDESLVGVLQVLNKREGAFDTADQGLAVALAAQCAVAIQRAKMTTALVEAEQYRRELEVAQSVQRSTFPAGMPRVPGYEVHGVCRPAGLTGGDTFDVVPVGNALLLALADATGHGVGPALSVARLHAMLQMALRLGASLEETLQRSNQLLAESLEEDRFITAFLGLLDPAAHQLRFQSAGQAPILVYRAATCVWEKLGPTTIPLGAMPVMKSQPAVELSLEPGDMVALVSDGLFEQRGEGGEVFGEERVRQRLALAADETPERAVEALLGDVSHFSGAQPQDDDITVVLLKRAVDGASVACDFPRTFESLEPIFAFGEAFCQANAIRDDVLRSLDFVLEELFTNMVKYNAGGSPTVHVRLARVGNQLRASLTETDVPRFDVTQVPDADVSASLDERKPGGLGLHLVRRLTESLSYAYAERDRRSQVSVRLVLSSTAGGAR